MDEHSEAWWQGYNYLGPRCRNPYAVDRPEHEEWNDGWQIRFYGEKP